MSKVKMVNPEHTVQNKHGVQKPVSYREFIDGAYETVNDFVNDLWECEGDVWMSQVRKLSELRWQLHWIKKELDKEN